MGVEENKIQNEILDYLTSSGFYCWRNQQMAGYGKRKAGKHHRNGLPDIEGIMPDGKYLGVEVKTKIGDVSEAQLSHITKAHNLNAVCFVARCLDDVVQGLKKYL